MPENRLLRALCALPILALTWPMLRVFGMMDIVGPSIAKVINQSRYDLQDGNSVPIINGFYGIPALDKALEPISIFFGQILFYEDPKTYWQSIVFLTEFAGFYAILILESFRAANRWTIFQIPSVLALAAQFVTIGNTAPLYFYLFYVFSPPKKLATANARLIDGAGAVAVLPMVVLVFLIPHANSLFHPNLEARLWWNWIWQLYPVWGSAVIFVLTNILAFVLDDRVEVVRKRNHTVLRFTAGVLATTSTITYWRTLLYSDDAVNLIRVLFQYDYIISFGAALLWLAYHLGDLKTSGVCKTSWVRILLNTVAIGVAGGPGTLLLFGWIAREEIMSSMQHEKAQ